MSGAVTDCEKIDWCGWGFMERERSSDWTKLAAQISLDDYVTQPS